MENLSKNFKDLVQNSWKVAAALSGDQTSGVEYGTANTTAMSDLTQLYLHIAQKLNETTQDLDIPVVEQNYPYTTFKTWGEDERYDAVATMIFITTRYNRRAFVTIKVTPKYRFIARLLRKLGVSFYDYKLKVTIHLKDDDADTMFSSGPGKPRDVEYIFETVKDYLWSSGIPGGYIPIQN